MSNHIRIDEADYELLLESAKKTAETMSPEQLAQLRTKCSYELSLIISETKKTDARLLELGEQLGKPIDYAKNNPVREAKIRFWLGQLGNLILGFVVPREFLPIYEYPGGSAKKFEEQAKAFDAKLRHLATDGKAVTEASLKGLCDVRSSIADDTGLVLFCNSCGNAGLDDQSVAVSDPFRKVASLFYLNNVSFDVKAFRTDTTNKRLTNGIDAACERIKRCYEEARELSAVSEGIIRCYEKAKSLPDLIGGIKRIIKTDEQKQVDGVTDEQKQTILEPVETQPDTALLLQRAFQFLEDRDWKNADAYCEKALDLDPINAEAYLGKLMAELHVGTRDILKYLSEAFDDRENYKRAFRFGDETLKAMLAEDNEKARVNGIYKAGIQAMKAAVTESEYRSAAETFKTIPGFKDADDLSLACQRKADEIAEEARVAEEKTEKKRKMRKRIIAIAASLLAACIVFAIVWKWVVIPNRKYDAAVELYTAGRYEDAIAAFKELNGYKDSAAQIQMCNTAIKDEQYAAAVELYTAGKYEDAIEEFRELDGYKDSAAKIEACETAIKDKKYAAAVELCSAGQYMDAMAAFRELDGYKDSAAKIDEVKPEVYAAAVELCDAGQYVDAMAAFAALDGYKDSAAKMDEIKPKYYQQMPAHVSVGSSIFFGSYEQDNDTSNGQEVIEWIVLAKGENSALIISKYALDCQVFNSMKTDVTWETCSLRRWLNGTFLDAAFSSSEQSMLPSSHTVFLLSISEVNRYFSSDEARKCAPTEYAIARGVNTSDNHSTGGKAACSWWLRSQGSFSNFIAFIHDDGSVYDKGTKSVDFGHYGVRPALWIDLALFPSDPNA